MTAILNWWKSHPALQKALTDFWTPVASAALSAALAFQVPADGNLKVAIFLSMQPVINVAINSARRAWSANAVPVIKELSGSQTDEIEQLVNLLNNLGNVDTSYVSLIRTWAHAQIGKLLR